jgi:hypothetical protein
MSKERRQSKRIPFKSNADITFAGKSYLGSIQDISEQGVQYILTSLSDVSSDFIPERNSDLILKDPSGKKYKLKCEVKWYVRGKGKDKSMKLGMKIPNPPSKYKELIASLTNVKKAIA